MTRYRKVIKSPGVRGSLKQHYDIDHIFYAAGIFRSAYGREWMSGVFRSQAEAEDWLRKIDLAQRVLTIKFNKRRE